MAMGTFRRTGRWPASMSIRSKEKVVRHKIPSFTMKLLPRQEALLKEHATHHTRRHVDYMRQLISIGIPFKEAHNRAQQFIGR